MLDSPPVSFVVTGTGRCGTGWAASALTALGHPCGHESYFDFHREPARQAIARFPSKAGAQAGPLEGDSSLAAAAYLDRLAAGTPVLHLVRDPLAVFNSFIGSHFFAGACPCHPTRPGHHLRGKYARWMLEEVPDLADFADHDEWGRTVRWITAWNLRTLERATELRLPYQRHRLEDLTTYALELYLAARHLLPGDPIVPTEVIAAAKTMGDVNAHTPASVSWAEFSGTAAGDELAAHCVDLGYPPPRHAH